MGLFAEFVDSQRVFSIGVPFYCIFINLFMEKRIHSYDVLRGIVMFLVVLGHLFMFSFGSKPLPVFVKIFTAFHVPVFFFVAGMFFSIDKRQTIADKSLFLLKKAIYLIVPTLFFYALYYYSHNLNPLAAISEGFGFYWFLPTLFMTMLVVWCINLLCKPIKNNNIELVWVIVAIIISVLLGLKGVNLNNEHLGFLQFSHLFFFFPSFAFGYLYRLRPNTVRGILKNRAVVTLIIMLGFISVGMTQMSDILSQGIISLNYWMRIYLLTFVALACFFHYQSFFESESITNRFLVVIGRYTLPIYVLHYFFMPDLTWLRDIMGDNSTTLVLIILVVTAIAIIGLCLLFTKIISISDFLGHYLLGQKSEKYKI